MLKAYGASGHVYTHAVTASPTTSIETRTSTFTSMMALVAADVAAGSLEVVSPATFTREGAPPIMRVALANPSRLVLTAGASPFDLINTGYLPLRFQISGGTVSTITYSRNGSTFDTVGAAMPGQFDVNPGDRLQITYTIAPTIVQYSI